ncbi:glycosyltransferase family 2 protein, partial [candidate division KSB1 bacterium]|nr:glycosyltransferase family 2 protein [candidate division KSB1 bacterium]
MIIPVFNQSHYTYQCLKSILENSPQDLYEVIIVDDRSTDDTQKILNNIKNIKVITNTENLGFLQNCNKGSKASKGEFILFLNNDTEVMQAWLTSMLSIFERFEKVGAVGAKLIYPDGKLQEAGGIIWKDGSGWNYGKRDNAEKPEYNYLREVDYCSAACLMVRADVFSEIGCFDERYIPGYFEDTDLAFSIRDQGYKVLYQPQAVVIHYEGVSAGRDLTKGFKQSQEINRLKFVEKWQTVLDKQHYLPPEQLTDPITFIAREKCGQKRILIVDHYVPEFDKDSGSLRMYEYINILVQLGHKVVFLPDNRFRSMPYTQRLQQIGVEVLFGHLDFEDYIIRFGEFFDIAILSRPHIA